MEKKGWEISMHGLNHVYDNDTKFKDYFNYGGKSEFFGHEYSHQFNKIKLGKEKLYNEGIKVKSFFAPNHTYDDNTFKALHENNIKIVIDGYGLFPYKAYELIFVPQLFHRELMLPFGIQSTQIHLNYWNDEYYNNFKIFIQNYHNKIKDFEEILESLSANNLKVATRNILRFMLSNIRKLDKIKRLRKKDIKIRKDFFTLSSVIFLSEVKIDLLTTLFGLINFIISEEAIFKRI